MHTDPAGNRVAGTSAGPRRSLEEDLGALLAELDRQPASGPGHPGPGAYVAVFVLFVVLGLSFGSAVVNWVVGPLFPALLLGAVPALAARLRRVLGGRAAS